LGAAGRDPHPAAYERAAAEYILWAQKPPLLIPVNDLKTERDRITVQTQKRDNIEEIIKYANGNVMVTEESNNLMVLTIAEANLPLFINSYINKPFGSIPIFYMAPPFPNNSFITQIPMTFMLSFVLGMLCRYFLSHWMGLTRGQLGDEVWPLTQVCVNYVERAFPQLVMEFIQEKNKEGREKSFIRQAAGRSLKHRSLKA
jgi:hypothetical protein